jgi:LysR family glycine cleavage system transcriptional activator
MMDTRRGRALNRLRPTGEDRLRKLPPLNAIRAFEAAARRRSFTAAAEELGVTVTAVSHQVRLLEQTLGQRLFQRSGRAIALSAAGERIYPKLRDGFDILADAFAENRERRAGETITLATTRAFAERWLMPRLDRFAAIAPDVVVSIDASEDLADLSADGIDLAVRYGLQRQDGTQLLADSYCAVAAADICPNDAPVIADFAGRPLLAYRWRNATLDGPDWNRWFGRPLPEGTRISWHSEETLALQAAERGFGPLLCSAVLVADRIAAGSLRRLQGPMLGGYGFRLLIGPAGRRKRSVAAFADWLRAEASTG